MPLSLLQSDLIAVSRAQIENWERKYPMHCAWTREMRAQREMRDSMLVVRGMGAQFVGQAPPAELIEKGDDVLHNA